MKLCEISKEIYSTTYQFGEEKTIEDTWKRIAIDLAEVEKKRKRNFWAVKFYELLEDFKFLPGGRIISNAGLNLKGTTYINCFVDGFVGEDQDSMNSILKTLGRQASILKSEGGYGFCSDVLRPRGSYIGGIAGESPGSVEMLRMWNEQSYVITKGSGKIIEDSRVKKKIRKGAMMVTQSCWHPDIEEFIVVKQQKNVLSKFNMSVLITDEFMESVINHKPWNLIFPDYENEKYKNLYRKYWNGNIDIWRNIVGEEGIKVYKSFKDAGELWNLIMTSTYNRNEPGVLFIDTINKKNNLWYCEKINATNPCGEQPLPIYGTCLLSNINLTQFLDLKNRDWDYDSLKKWIPIMVRFMDNVIEKANLPLKEQEIELKKKRRIGLGVLGYGSALYMLKLRYGSSEALSITKKLMSFISSQVYLASVNLAREKGKFPLFDKVKYLKSNFLEIFDSLIKGKIKRYGIRNSHLLSIQPTGNTSILANNVSGGIEPIFLTKYIRTFIIDSPPTGLQIPIVIDWEKKKVENLEGWEWVKEGDEWLLKKSFEGNIYKYDMNRGLLKESIVEDYSVTYLKEKGEWDEKSYWAVTTESLSIEEHISTLELFSKYIDSGISKTINLPNDYSFENFKEVYLKAWNTHSIKGITTYRAGTMASVLSSLNTNKVSLSDYNSPKRPKILEASVVRFINDSEEWVAIIGLLNNRPYEIFTGKYLDFQIPKGIQKGFVIKEKKEGKSFYNFGFGSDEENLTIVGNLALSFNPEYWNYAKLISGVLRHGMPLHCVVDMIQSLDLRDDNLNTWKSGVARVIKRFIPNNTKPKNPQCPSCKTNSLIYLEGCVKCINCNYSQCN